MGEPKDKVGKAIIAAKSFFSGAVNFIVLGIPYGWKIHPNQFPPEIDRYAIFDKYAWVTRGNVTHGISIGEGKALGIELVITNKLSSKNRYKLIRGHRSGEFYIYGHKASYVLGDFEKGRLSKRSFRGLHVSFICDVTKRKIEIYFVGKDIDDVYRDIVFALPQSICH